MSNVQEMNVQQSKHYKLREQTPYFLNKEQHEFYIKNGWVKIENVIEESEINDFFSTYNRISKLEGFELTEQFLNTGCMVNPELRQLTSDVINRNVKTILPRLFDMEKVEIHTGGSFVIKPVSKESALEIHQDSSFIDEEKYYSLFMWIPFCNVNKENGYLSVLPGSHLWGSTQRGFGVPWNLAKHIELMKNYMLPVYANKGDVILFDPALVHASAPNLSTETRHAITITVAPKNPELVYYYKDDKMPADYIEKYYVNEDFFKTYDFASKPDETVWRKEVIPYKSFDLSESQILSLIETNLPE